MAHAQMRLADGMASGGTPASLTPVARSWARRTALLGAFLLVMFGGFYLLPGVRAANRLCGHAPDIVGFELARSNADIARIFANDPAGCQAATVAAMDSINHMDLPWFILVYAAFMASAALFQSAKHQQRRWLWGLLAAAIAVIGDIVETGMLLRITTNLAEFDSSRWALMVGTSLKWLGIGGLAGLTAALTLRRAPRRWALGGISLAGALATLLALISPASFGAIMGLALMLHWVALWLDAVRGLLRR